MKRSAPTVPYLPENAPFTPEQRAYLNGLFAGLFSTAPGLRPEAAATGRSLAPLTVLFGSQTGTAERLAKLVAKEGGRRGFAPTVHDLGAYSMEQLRAEKNVLVVTSTYGDGEPPDNAKRFWEMLARDGAPRLEGVKFSLCALGDSNYPKFCAFGQSLDERLEKLGAQRVSPRVDCDVEFEELFSQWLDEALTRMQSAQENLGTVDGVEEPVMVNRVAKSVESAEVRSVAAGPALSGYSRTNPFPSPLLVNRRLNGPGSLKDTRHIAFSLAESGLAYQAGDALGVMPTNCPELVKEVISALRSSPEVVVPGLGGETTLQEALLRVYNITRITKSLLQAMSDRSGDPLLLKLCAPNVNGELTEFLHGREVIDLLLEFPNVEFKPSEFVGLLQKLQPRLYSISSSPKEALEQVHLCVGVVRFHSLGRVRKGVCSTFLAERVDEGSSVPTFVHQNNNFRPPTDLTTPMIMVGPGTGIAPFRAFLQERRATGARGRNWLFFGDQRAGQDFLYQDEMDAFVKDGTLTRLETAFSRDQEKKVYVQHRMTEHARELYAWLESGAHFYVCGDATRMAKDVDAALHRVIVEGGGKTSEQAQAFVEQMKQQRRYQRDVY